MVGSSSLPAPDKLYLLSFTSGVLPFVFFFVFSGFFKEKETGGEEKEGRKEL